MTFSAECTQCGHEAKEVPVGKRGSRLSDLSCPKCGGALKRKSSGEAPRIATGIPCLACRKTGTSRTMKHIGFDERRRYRKDLQARGGQGLYVHRAEPCPSKITTKWLALIRQRSNSLYNRMLSMAEWETIGDMEAALNIRMLMARLDNPGLIFKVCEPCHGWGWVQHLASSPQGWSTEDCSTCGGLGYVVIREGYPPTPR